MQQPDGIAIAFNPPAIRGLGTAGGFEVYVQTRAGADPLQLSTVVNNFIEALNQEPRLAGIATFFRPTVPQFFVEVDDAKAISQQVRIADIYATLQSMIGSFYVNDLISRDAPTAYSCRQSRPSDEPETWVGYTCALNPARWCRYPR